MAGFKKASIRNNHAGKCRFDSLFLDEFWLCWKWTLSCGWIVPLCTAALFSSCPVWPLGPLSYYYYSNRQALCPPRSVFLFKQFFSWFTKVRQEAPCSSCIDIQDKFIAAVKWQTWAVRWEWAHAKSSQCEQKPQDGAKTRTRHFLLDNIHRTCGCRSDICVSDGVCWPTSHTQMHVWDRLSLSRRQHLDELIETVETHGRQHACFPWQSVFLLSHCDIIIKPARETLKRGSGSLHWLNVVASATSLSACQTTCVFSWRRCLCADIIYYMQILYTNFPTN